MYTVALTGGIGSGKSEASNIFASLGVPIVDLDVISHALTNAKQPLVNELAAAFGQAYVTEDGALNRQKMRQLVFNDADARRQLNTILHPAILAEASRQLKKNTSASYSILAIPLLEQNGPYASMIDRTLVIDCDEVTQIKRVKARSNLTEVDVKKIIKTQTPRQARIAMADDVIVNDGGIEKLRANIEKLHQKYIKTCIVKKTIS